MEARHRVRVGVLAVAQRVRAVRALDLESEVAVQAHRVLVADIHGQFDAQRAEPVVGEVDQRVHQPGADAPVVPVVAHRHAEVPRVRAARVLVAVQSGVADDLFRGHRHQNVVSRRIVGPEPLGPLRDRRIRVLQRSQRRSARAEGRRDAFRVRRLRPADDDVGHRRCSAQACTLASAERAVDGSVPPAIAMSARPPPLPPTCCAT